jgi:hypothetical protein
MSARQLPATDYAGLKAATRKQISINGGPVEAARSTRVGHQDLSRYGSTADDHDERFIPADVIADLEAECGQPIITRKLAELSGYVLIRLPQGRGPGRVLEASGRSAQDMGAMMMELGQALTDGRLTGPESAAIHERIQCLQIDLAELDAAVQAEAGEQK